MQPTKAETMAAAQDKLDDANAKLQAAIRQHRARKHLRRAASEARAEAPGADAVRAALNEDSRTHAAAIAEVLVSAESMLRDAGFESVRVMGCSGEPILRASIGSLQIGPDYSGSDSIMRAASLAVRAAQDSVAAAMQAWREARA